MVNRKESIGFGAAGGVGIREVYLLRRLPRVVHQDIDNQDIEKNRKTSFCYKYSTKAPVLHEK
jgi:hypothetical protein